MISRLFGICFEHPCLVVVLDIRVMYLNCISVFDIFIKHLFCVSLFRYLCPSSSLGILLGYLHRVPMLRIIVAVTE